MTPHPVQRRRFLALSGAATLAAGAGAQARGWHSPWHRYTRHLNPQALVRRRLTTALSQRLRTARKQFSAPVPQLPTNGDEKKYHNLIGSFSKALPHDDQGFVDRSAFKQLQLATFTGSARQFERIPLGGTRKLANPQAAFAYNLAGADGHAIGMPAAPAFASAWEAGEMVEVYWHAILRDVPFDQYAADPAASRAVADLNSLSDFRGPRSGGQVTPQTLFRGETAGDLAGNYLSQFLLLPVPVGATVLEQRYQVPQRNDDHMTTFDEWLRIQNGEAPSDSNLFDPTPRYLGTGRDLGEYVHRDFPYQAYLNACNILLGLGAPVQDGNPYNDIANQGAFVTFGAADILALVAETAHTALKSAWFHKWLVHRRLRPEAFAGAVHLQKTGAASFPIHPEVLDSSALDEVFDTNGTYLLPMAYPEGSPTHPAYPAGHAVVAGACVTVLKSFFAPQTVLDAPVEIAPGTDSTTLQPFSGTASLTVSGELDKLAANIALGRDIAGVHWRTDGTEGLKLGEQVALRLLQDRFTTYPERRGEISFTGFDGAEIVL